MKTFALLIIALLLLVLGVVIPASNAFQSSQNVHKQRSMSSESYQYNSFDVTSITGATRTTIRYDRSPQLSMGFIDGLQGFFKKFTTKASASHILIKGGAEAANKLEDIKTEIGDSPVAFAKAAAVYSACPSASKGGDLGSFGPGAMVKEFDNVVFNDEIGVTHGPIKTQFGYHLIFIRDRVE